MIAQETIKDKTLNKVMICINQNTWPGPSEADEDMKPFIQRKDELVAIKICILWGDRVVIPKSYQAAIIDILHCSHPGIVRSKALARSYVWYPKIDNDIEKCIKQCHK